jgi:tetratricopeptide (TPR) repeat protein
MAKKRGHVRRPANVARPPLPLLSGLDEADELMRRKKWVEARSRLEALDQRYPGYPEVLGPLVNVNYELKDMKGYQRACERLLPLEPDDPDVTIGLAGAYMLNVRPSLALRTFRRFLERFPDDPRAPDARKTVAELEPTIAELLAQAGLSGAEGFELGELHEEIQSALDQHDYPQVRKLAEQLLKRKPDFAPALNNLSQSYLLEGKLDQAITTAQRVLAFDPGNIHALANLVVYHCRLGQPDEAGAWAERLKQSDQEGSEKQLKIAEALSFLGDDAGVLEAFDAAERQGKQMPAGAEALLCHLAAVAELRQGREAAARRLWRRALKLSPGMQEARENLDDLSKPVGERHAPWPYLFSNWVTREVLGQLSRQVEGKKNDQALTNAIRRFLQKHPEIAALVPSLLDRGDPQARQFALMTARTAATPELLAALHDFALGQRGPDAQRHEAAQAADEADLFPERRARMWLGGEWQDIMFMGFEITDEPLQQYGPKIMPLLRQANDALHAGQGARAERLLQQALELEPDSPALLNNLALSYNLQGREDDALALTREIHERYPDYLFARIALARLAMREGDLDSADEMIKPLLARRRLHFTEANALFAVQIDLHLAHRNPDAARSWLDMWEGVDPDNPELERRRLAVEAGGRTRARLGRRR